MAVRVPVASTKTIKIAFSTVVRIADLPDQDNGIIGPNWKQEKFTTWVR
jgi:hypothetical protein